MQMRTRVNLSSSPTISYHIGTFSPPVRPECRRPINSERPYGSLVFHCASPAKLVEERYTWTRGRSLRSGQLETRLFGVILHVLDYNLPGK